MAHSTTLRHQGRGVAKILDESGTGSGSGPKSISGIFSKDGLVASSGARDINFFTPQAPVPSKTFRRLLVLSKTAGSGGSGSESGSAFMFATVGGTGPITFHK